MNGIEWEAIRATSMIWKWRQRESSATSAHHKGVELVAFGIPKVRRVEILTALAGRTFAAAAERQSELVDAVHLGLVLGAECRHDAVADGHRLAVIGKGDAEARATAGAAPGDQP